MMMPDPKTLLILTTTVDAMPLGANARERDSCDPRGGIGWLAAGGIIPNSPYL